jgi:hypothetical protein
VRMGQPLVTARPSARTNGHAVHGGNGA